MASRQKPDPGRVRSSATKRTITNPDGTRTTTTTTTTYTPEGSVTNTTTENLPSLPEVSRESYHRPDGTVGWKKITTVVYPGGRKEVKVEHESAISSSASRDASLRSSGPVGSIASGVPSMSESFDPNLNHNPAVGARFHKDDNISKKKGTSHVVSSTSSNVSSVSESSSIPNGPEIISDDAGPRNPVSQSISIEKKKVKGDQLARAQDFPSTQPTVEASAALAVPETIDDNEGPSAPFQFNDSVLDSSNAKKKGFDQIRYYDENEAENSNSSMPPSAASPQSFESEACQINNNDLGAGDNTGTHGERNLNIGATAPSIRTIDATQISAGATSQGDSIQEIHDYVVPMAMLVEPNNNLQSNVNPNFPVASNNLQSQQQYYGNPQISQPQTVSQPHQTQQPPQSPHQPVVIDVVTPPVPDNPKLNKLWIFGGIAAVIVIALAVGVGVAVSQKSSAAVENNPIPAPSPDPVDPTYLDVISRSPSVSPVGSSYSGVQIPTPEETVPTTSPSGNVETSPPTSKLTAPEDLGVGFCLDIGVNMDFCVAIDNFDAGTECTYFTRTSDTKEVTGICNSCYGCGGGNLASDCSNLGGEIAYCEGEEPTESVAAPTSLPVAASNPAPSGVEFAVDDYECFGPISEFFEACIALACGEPGCACHTYFRDLDTKENAGSCSFCTPCPRVGFDLYVEMECTLKGADITVTCDGY